MNSYLLGKLTEEEAARFEAEWFDDDTRYAEFKSAQDDLFDAYAANRLSAADRELFERHALASPFLRQRAEFAQSLAEQIANEPAASGWLLRLKELLSSPAAGWRWGFATAMLLILFGGGWLFREVWRLRDQVKQTESLLAAETEQNAKERARAAQLANQLEAEKARVAQLEAEKQTQPQNAVASIFSFVLTPLAFRDGANLPRLNIPATAQTVQLRLRFDSQQTFRHFTVRVETIEGSNIWSNNRLTASGQQVIASLPTRLLPTNDYLVKLSGRAADNQQQEIASYQMRVSRQ